MTVRLLRLPLVGAALLLALVASASPQDPPPPPDPADDPLPEGAKTRFGVTRPILRGSPAVALLAPTYKNYLAPTASGSVRRYDVATGRPFTKVTQLENLVAAGTVVASGDGKRAVVARSGSLNVVDASNGKQILGVTPPEGVILPSVPGVSLSADGKVLAFGGRNQEGKGEVVVWDVDKNEALARVVVVAPQTVHPTLSADGKLLATHGPPPPPPVVRAEGAPPPVPPAVDPEAARVAQVWDVATGKELFKARVTGMGGLAVAAAFSPDATLVAVSAGDGPVDLFEVKTGKRVQTFLGRKAQGARLAFSPDGKTVASAGPDYRIQRWEVNGKSLGPTDPPPGMLLGPLAGLAFADNERVLAWSTAAQFAYVWEAPAAKLHTPLMDHAAAIRCVSFADGGKDVFTSGTDSRLMRWDLASGLLSEQINLKPARIPGQPPVRPYVHLTPDAALAVTVRAPGEVFDVATGEDLYNIPPPSTPPASHTVTVATTGRKAITVIQSAMNRPGSCVVWDLDNRQRVAELDLPASTSTPVAALSPSGTRLVVATTNRNPNTGGAALVITGYDLKTGKKLAEVEDPGATSPVYIATASETAAVLTNPAGRIWAVDYEAGRLGDDIDKLTANGETAIYTPVAFSPDGKRFAIGVVGETLETYGVRVYDWPRGRQLHTFMGHVGPVSTLQFAPDGKSLASGSQDTSVLLWDLAKIPVPK